MMIIGGGAYGRGYNDANSKEAKYWKERNDEEKRHSELVKEVEKATGKVMIIVGHDEIYVDKQGLEKLVGKKIEEKE